MIGAQVPADAVWVMGPEVVVAQPGLAPPLPASSWVRPARLSAVTRPRAVAVRRALALAMAPLPTLLSSGPTALVARRRAVALALPRAAKRRPEQGGGPGRGGQS